MELLHAGKVREVYADGDDVILVPSVAPLMDAVDSFERTGSRVWSKEDGPPG